MRANTEGEFRFSLAKELQLTDFVSVFTDSEYDTETQWEGMIGAEFTLRKNISLVGQYHSEFHGGGGVVIRF